MRSNHKLVRQSESLEASKQQRFQTPTPGSRHGYLVIYLTLELLAPRGNRNIYVNAPLSQCSVSFRNKTNIPEMRNLAESLVGNIVGRISETVDLYEHVVGRQNGGDERLGQDCCVGILPG